MNSVTTGIESSSLEELRSSRVERGVRCPGFQGAGRKQSLHTVSVQPGRKGGGFLLRVPRGKGNAPSIDRAVLEGAHRTSGHRTCISTSRPVHTGRSERQCDVGVRPEPPLRPARTGSVRWPLRDWHTDEPGRERVEPSGSIACLILERGRSEPASGFLRSGWRDLEPPGPPWSGRPE